MSNVPKSKKTRSTKQRWTHPNLSTCLNLRRVGNLKRCTSINLCLLIFALCEQRNYFWHWTQVGSEVSSSTSRAVGFASDSSCSLPFFGPPCALVDVLMQHASAATLATYSTCCCLRFMVQPGVTCIPARPLSSFWPVPRWKWSRWERRFCQNPSFKCLGRDKV